MVTIFIFFSNLIELLLMSYRLKKIFQFVYPSGKPISPHLLCCHGLAVANYSVALGRLTERNVDPATGGKAEATSAFAQLGLQIHLASRFVADQMVVMRYETSRLTAGFSRMMTKLKQI